MLEREDETAMAVIPAIDLLDGHVVRLRQGRYDQVSDFGDQPERVAQGYREQGATLLHVIDLSAARDGRRPARHAAIIRRLVEGSGMAVQVGGGIGSGTTCAPPSTWAWRGCWWARWRPSSRP